MQYQLIFEVPDDFNPENLELSANYPEPIALVGEGVVDNEDMLDKLRIAVKEQVEIQKLEITPNSVVTYKFPLGTPVEYANKMKEVLEQELGCTVIGLANDFDIFVQNSAEAIDMLNKMIAKINLHSSIKIAH